MFHIHFRFSWQVWWHLYVLLSSYLPFQLSWNPVFLKIICVKATCHEWFCGRLSLPIGMETIDLKKSKLLIDDNPIPILAPHNDWDWITTNIFCYIFFLVIGEDTSVLPYIIENLWMIRTYIWIQICVLSLCNIHVWS